MSRCLALLLVFVWALVLGTQATAQRTAVVPNDAELIVTIENSQDPFLESEMVLLTIHGIYRRYITREKLVQPQLNGFGWMQLGEDHWYDSVENGLKVKNMRRRMAIFPSRAGQIEIGAFQHRLTFLDENLKWFEHTIASTPIVIDVGPSDPDSDWWLPVHRLEIEDNWSNAPDQMKPGEGVLRVIRVEGHGASPDMLPPMPELRSPTAHIFPHPEKRLVELTPLGPVGIAYWRWTLRPTNAVSAIIEPIEVEFFDTVKRETQVAKITAQRIAYGGLTGREAQEPPPAAALSSPAAATIAGPLALRLGFLLAVVLALVALLRTVSVAPVQELARRFGADRNSRALKRATRSGTPGPFRKAAHALVAENELSVQSFSSLQELDETLFSGSGRTYDLKAVLQDFRTELKAARQGSRPQ